MIEERLSISAGGPLLEACLAYEDTLDAPAVNALICPPHPFLGGDMDNNVVRTLAHALVAAGIPTLRFNYRGIGGSASERDLSADQREFWERSTCPRYEAEIHLDCARALAALQANVHVAIPPIVIGYSFGCLPALELAARAPLSFLGLISPPLAKWQIDSRALDLACPCALYYAPDDFACPTERIESLARSARGACTLQCFPQAEHFFIGHEPALAAAVIEGIGRQ